jgi:protein-serine/threonine kinase
VADYEQQRLHLLHKHGVDLEGMNALQDGMRTKRMNRKDIESLMGGGDSEGGLFTWREKHGKKVGLGPLVLLRMRKGC